VIKIYRPYYVTNVYCYRYLVKKGNIVHVMHCSLPDFTFGMFVTVVAVLQLQLFVYTQHTGYSSRKKKQLFSDKYHS